MNGKDYVIKAVEMTEQMVSEVQGSDLLDDAEMVEGMANAAKSLGNVKNKPTLRTKAGTNMAFPVYDAAQQCVEAWEEAQEQNDPDELRDRMEEFVSSVEILLAGLKDRTVIMT